MLLFNEIRIYKVSSNIEKRNDFIRKIEILSKGYKPFMDYIIERLRKNSQVYYWKFN